MWRKRITLALLTLLSLSILSSALTPVRAWDPSTLIANASDSPTINGEKDTEWSSTEVNISYGEIGTRKITLFVMYEGSFLYILVEVRFETSVPEETISLSISNITDSTDQIFTDRKYITMFNASSKGDEYFDISDSFYSDDSEEYMDDLEDSGFDGAAAYDPDSTNRFYEFKVQRSVSNETENVELLFADQYAFRVGYNTTDDSIDLSDQIVIQIGTSTDSEEDIGEYVFPVETYIRVVLWVALGAVVIFGGLIIQKVTTLEKINERDRILLEGE